MSDNVPPPPQSINLSRSRASALSKSGARMLLRRIDEDRSERDTLGPTQQHLWEEGDEEEIVEAGSSANLRKIGGNSISGWRKNKDDSGRNSGSHPGSPLSPHTAMSPASPLASSGLSRLNSPSVSPTSPYGYNFEAHKEPGKYRAPSEQTSKSLKVSSGASTHKLLSPLSLASVGSGLSKSPGSSMMCEAQIDDLDLSKKEKHKRKGPLGDEHIDSDNDEQLANAFSALDSLNSGHNGYSSARSQFRQSPILEFKTVDAVNGSQQTSPPSERSSKAEDLSPTGSEAWFQEYKNTGNSAIHRIDDIVQKMEGKHTIEEDEDDDSIDSIEEILDTKHEEEFTANDTGKRRDNSATIRTRVQVEEGVRKAIKEFVKDGFEWRSVFDEGVDVGGTDVTGMAASDIINVRFGEIKSSVFLTCMEECFSLDRRESEILASYYSGNVPETVDCLRFINTVRPTLGNWKGIEKFRFLLRQRVKLWGLGEDLRPFYEDLVDGPVETRLNASKIYSIAQDQFEWTSFTYADAVEVLRVMTLLPGESGNLEASYCDFVGFLNDFYFEADVLPKLCEKLLLMGDAKIIAALLRSTLGGCSSISSFKSGMRKLGLTKGEGALSNEDIGRMARRFDTSGTRESFSIEYLINVITKEMAKSKLSQGGDSVTEEGEITARASKSNAPIEISEDIVSESKYMELSSSSVKSASNKKKKNKTKKNKTKKNAKEQAPDTVSQMALKKDPKKKRHTSSEHEETDTQSYEEMVYKEGAKAEAMRALSWGRNNGDSNATDTVSTETKSQQVSNLRSFHEDNEVEADDSFIVEDNDYQDNDVEAWGGDENRVYYGWEHSSTQNGWMEEQGGHFGECGDGFSPEVDGEEHLSTDFQDRDEEAYEIAYENWSREVINNASGNGASARRLGPAEDDILDFALYLGMDPDKDSEWLWLAEECLYAPLPKGWRQARDSSATGRGDFYYWKAGDPLRTTQWEHPLDGFFRKLFERLKAEKLHREQDEKTGKSLRIQDRQRRRKKQSRPQSAMQLNRNGNGVSPQDSVGLSILRTVATGGGEFRNGEDPSESILAGGKVASSARSRPSSAIAGRRSNKIQPFGQLNEVGVETDNRAEEILAVRGQMEVEEEEINDFGCQFFSDEQIRPIWWVSDDLRDLSNGEIVYDFGTSSLTPEHVLDLSTFFQLDLPRESNLMWIVKAAALASLPPGWRLCMDEFTREPFYANYNTFQVLRHHPLDRFFALLLRAEREVQLAGSTLDPYKSHFESMVLFKDDDGDSFWYDFAEGTSVYDISAWSQYEVALCKCVSQSLNEGESEEWLETLRSSLLHCLVDAFGSEGGARLKAKGNSKKGSNACALGPLFDSNGVRFLGRLELIKVITLLEWILAPEKIGAEIVKKEYKELKILVKSRRETSEQLTKHVSMRRR